MITLINLLITAQSSCDNFFFLISNYEPYVFSYIISWVKCEKFIIKIFVDNINYLFQYCIDLWLFLVRKNFAVKYFVNNTMNKIYLC